MTNLSKFFSGSFENQFMTQQHISMPVHYSRYVYIFCVSNSLEYAKMFLSLLSNLHPNLMFTYEI